VLSTDRIEIHQLQPLVWPSDLLYVMLAGCDWWISIRSVDNVYDWRKFWKRLHVCFVFQSRVSAKTVVINLTTYGVILFSWQKEQCFVVVSHRGLVQRCTLHFSLYWKNPALCIIDYRRSIRIKAGDVYFRSYNDNSLTIGEIKLHNGG